MQIKSHIYYVKYTICEQTFFSRYFARHECSLRDTSEGNNEMKTDDDDDDEDDEDYDNDYELFLWYG